MTLSTAVKRVQSSPLGTAHEISLPDVELHCTSKDCNGVRFFAPSSDRTERVPSYRFIQYVCRNCGRTGRTFAIAFQWVDAKEPGGALTAMKLGEDPPFGPPTPSRVLSMVGPDRDAFLKGRRCEFQQLGIAAFAYYRRVVENQKGRLIDEIVRVSERVGADADVLADLHAARRETQFSAAVDRIRHGVPQALRIEGHNPLTLLHSALSEGLHAQSDEECLELATSIRLVLVDLAERLDLALRDQAELSSAVSRLLSARGAAAQRAKRGPEADPAPGDPSQAVGGGEIHRAAPDAPDAEG